jgi:protoporphyrinogen oxidase
VTVASIVILGAGPAGLALALRLLQRDDLDAEVHVIEREPVVGGLAGSFCHRGICFDYGSHRLHPAIGPEPLAELQALLGDDLALRPRRGRIRLGGRFVGYPLRPLDLATRLPPRLMLGLARDAAARLLRRSQPEAETYAATLEAALGPTLAQAFYFPYARKLWGLAPDQIAAEQAKRRVSAGSLTKMVRRVLASVLKLDEGTSGQSYYYPRRGFGQICEALAEAVTARGGQIHLGAQVEVIHLQDGPTWDRRPPGRQGGAGAKRHGMAELALGAPRGGHGARLTATRIYSTIPLGELVPLLDPAPEAIRDAAAGLRYRAMVLCYLILPVDRFTPYDAHYFPGAETAISRVSEPKNYFGAEAPKGLTGLCVELPCWPEDPVWSMSDAEVGALALRELERAGLPLAVPPQEALVRRQRHAYPVYDLAFAARLERIEAHIGAIPELVTLGRQGLFAHDNVHHAFAMAWAASDALRGAGAWDEMAWRAARERFREHVVVD